MTTDLERALSKLRFDDQVLGYSLMTKAGRPFVSFAFPDDLFPRVKDSINLYKSDLRLMTIDTEKGLVVLSPVDDNWILTVLYVPELQLGLAIAKTKNVLRLLEGIELPPPPEEFEESVDSNLQVLESIAIKAASTTPTEPVIALKPEPAPTPVFSSVTTTPPTRVEPEVGEKTPADFDVQPSTIPLRGAAFTTALSLDSALNTEMKKIYRNFGFDVLMLVDEKIKVEIIAETMFQSNERVSELLKWAASKGIVVVPILEEKAKSKPATMGRFVKCPKFDGTISKIEAADVPILQLCDGTKTTQDISKESGIPHSKVIQILARYRKQGLRMIGRTV